MAAGAGHVAGGARPTASTGSQRSLAHDLMGADGFFRVSKADSRRLPSPTSNPAGVRTSGTRRESCRSDGRALRRRHSAVLCFRGLYDNATIRQWELPAAGISPNLTWEATSSSGGPDVAQTKDLLDDLRKRLGRRSPKNQKAYDDLLFTVHELARSERLEEDALRALAAKIRDYLESLYD